MRNSRQAAGKLLIQMQNSVNMREKGPKDLVSEADEAAQELIRSQLNAPFLNMGFWVRRTRRKYVRKLPRNIVLIGLLIRWMEPPIICTKCRLTRYRSR